MRWQLPHVTQPTWEHRTLPNGKTNNTFASDSVNETSKNCGVRHRSMHVDCWRPFLLPPLLRSLFFFSSFICRWAYSIIIIYMQLSIVRMPTARAADKVYAHRFVILNFSCDHQSDNSTKGRRRTLSGCCRCAYNVERRVRVVRRKHHILACYSCT